MQHLKARFPSLTFLSLFIALISLKTHSFLEICKDLDFLRKNSRPHCRSNLDFVYN